MSRPEEALHRLAVDLGYRYDGVDGQGHHRYVLRGYRVAVACSIGRSRSAANTEAHLRRVAARLEAGLDPITGQPRPAPAEGAQVETKKPSTRRHGGRRRR